MASCHRHITVATFRLHDAITNNNLGLITVCYDGTMISWSADITFWHRCKFKHSASWYSTDVKKKQCDETAVTNGHWPWLDLWYEMVSWKNTSWVLAVILWPNVKIPSKLTAAIFGNASSHLEGRFGVLHLLNLNIVLSWWGRKTEKQ